jgi:hypothetical protein
VTETTLVLTTNPVRLCYSISQDSFSLKLHDVFSDQFSHLSRQLSLLLPSLSLAATISIERILRISPIKTSTFSCQSARSTLSSGRLISVLGVNRCSALRHGIKLTPTSLDRRRCPFRKVTISYPRSNGFVHNLSVATHSACCALRFQLGAISISFGGRLAFDLPFNLSFALLGLLACFTAQVE